MLAGWIVGGTVFCAYPFRLYSTVTASYYKRHKARTIRKEWWIKVLGEK